MDQIPEVKNSHPVIISNSEIDKALTQGLDKEGLLRLKSVEQAILFSKDKNVNETQFSKLYETIYKFYNNVQ